MEDLKVLLNNYKRVLQGALTKEAKQLQKQSFVTSENYEEVFAFMKEVGKFSIDDKLIKTAKDQQNVCKLFFEIIIEPLQKPVPKATSKKTFISTMTEYKFFLEMNAEKLRENLGKFFRGFHDDNRFECNSSKVFSYLERYYDVSTDAKKFVRDETDEKDVCDHFSRVIVDPWQQNRKPLPGPSSEPAMPPLTPPYYFRSSDGLWGARPRRVAISPAAPAEIGSSEVRVIHTVTLPTLKTYFEKNLEEIKDHLTNLVGPKFEKMDKQDFMLCEAMQIILLEMKVNVQDIDDPSMAAAACALFVKVIVLPWLEDITMYPETYGKKTVSQAEELYRKLK